MVYFLEADMKKTGIFSSVKAKLILTMVVLAALPLIAATGINYYRTTANAKAEAMDSLSHRNYRYHRNIGIRF